MPRTTPKTILNTFNTTRRNNVAREQTRTSATGAVASIFMATPLDQNRASKLQLEQLLRDAAAACQNSELKTSIETLRYNLPDNAYSHISPGVALYIGTDSHLILRTAAPPLQPFATVNKAAHVLPVIRDLQQFPDHHVLAAETGSVRLIQAVIRGGRLQGNEKALPGRIPTEAVEAEELVDATPVLNYRSGIGNGAAFHGQGGAGDLRQELGERYLETVGRACKGLPEVDGPIVVMGSEKTVSILTATSGIDYVATVIRNPAKMDATAIADQTFKALEGYVANTVQRAHQEIERHYRTRVWHDNLANTPEEKTARISTLLLQPGQVYTNTYTHLVSQVLEGGGEVYIDPTMTHHEAVALLRW